MLATDLEELKKTRQILNEALADIKCSLRIAKRIHDKAWQQGLKIQLHRTDELDKRIRKLEDAIFGE